jgi:hypothetical protein
LYHQLPILHAATQGEAISATMIWRIHLLAVIAGLLIIAHMNRTIQTVMIPVVMIPVQIVDRMMNKVVSDMKRVMITTEMNMIVEKNVILKMIMVDGINVIPKMIMDDGINVIVEIIMVNTRIMVVKIIMIDGTNMIVEIIMID